MPSEPSAIVVVVLVVVVLVSPMPPAPSPIMARRGGAGRGEANSMHVPRRFHLLGAQFCTSSFALIVGESS